MSGRVQKLLVRLRRGMEKTAGLFGSLSPSQWEVILHEQPYPWTVRDLLAHFLSAEEGLLQLGQDIAAGGPGAPEGFDYDAFNAAEQKRLAEVSHEQLLSGLTAARQRTIEWVAGLQDEDLDIVGGHPALGEVTLETLLNAIYGHQLMHVRELRQVLE